MPEGRRISTIYSILCKWRTNEEERGKRRKRESEGRQRRRKGWFVNQRTSRCGPEPQLLSSSDINFTVEEGRRRRPIRREKKPGNRKNAVIQFTNVSLELELCLDTSADLPSVSLSSNNARTTSSIGCPVLSRCRQPSYLKIQKGTTTTRPMRRDVSSPCLKYRVDTSYLLALRCRCDFWQLYEMASRNLDTSNLFIFIFIVKELSLRPTLTTQAFFSHLGKNSLILTSILIALFIGLCNFL